MKNLTESSVGQRLQKLLGARIKTDYNVSLSLYPEKDAESPTCSHQCKGSSEHAMVTLLGGIAVIVLACTILRGICALLSKVFPSK